MRNFEIYDWIVIYDNLDGFRFLCIGYSVASPCQKLVYCNWKNLTDKR